MSFSRWEDIINIDELAKKLFKGQNKVDRELLEKLQQPLYSFSPRVNDPVNFDEQSGFVTDDFEGIKIAVAGNASGKTECAAYNTVNFLFKTQPPRDLCPFIIASQSFDMTGQIFQEKIQKYIQPSQIRYFRWRNAVRQFPAEVVLQPHNNGNRWVLDFRSYEQGRKQFQAVSIGGFWFDEQAPMGVLVECFMRCRDYDYTNNKFYTFTPLEPDYDLEELYKNRFEDNVKNTFKFYRMNTMCNTSISKTWKKNFFDIVPEDMQATRQIGAFCRFEGLIYKEFRDEVHVITQKISSEANHYRSIDFGFRNAACIWAALHQDRWLIYDELLVHDLLTEDFAQLIKDKSIKHGWIQNDMRFRSTYADWEDPASMLRLKQFEIYPTPARKEVGAGIDCVRGKLIGLGKIPQLYIMDNCKELIREIKEYSWQKGPKNPMNRVDEPEKPVKFHDHLVDALRYLIYSKETTVNKPWSTIKKTKEERGFYGVN